MTQSESALSAAEEAFAAGDWKAARDRFEAVLEVAVSPDAHDGLGRTLWWLGDVDGAIAHRERAYASFRQTGATHEAARIALWLSREYLEAVGNEPASNGWLARAEGLLRDADHGATDGWLELTKGSRAFEPDDMRRRAEAARAIAREWHDPALEASALALLGRALLLAGAFDDGISALDESMVAVTSGEVSDPVVFGDVCCVVTLAAEEAGELERLMRWNDIVETYLSRHLHGPLISFCGTCGAEFFQAKGDLEMAERCLVEALGALEGTGHRSRCIHPAAKLAELRIVQGRVEEAERLLAGYEDLPEALRASVEIHRLRGEHSVAAALLLRRLNRTGDSIVSVPLLSILVEVQLAQGMPQEAGASAARLETIASRSGHARLAAVADLARGRVARASGDAAASAHLERAVEGFARLELPLDAARARLELAHAVRETAPEVGAREARVAVETFERLGARREADRGAALVRELGGPARTGPKDVGLLTAREREVLDLLAEGLTNAEIAARLYISTKTVGNHVSNILAKLHLRSRQEAAAFAVRAAVGREPAER